MTVVFSNGSSHSIARSACSKRAQLDAHAAASPTDGICKMPGSYHLLFALGAHEACLQVCPGKMLQQAAPFGATAAFRTCMRHHLCPHLCARWGSAAVICLLQHACKSSSAACDAYCKAHALIVELLLAGGNYSVSSGSSEWHALDTNGDGWVDMSDDPYTPFYPGDQWVDWVGMNEYHMGQVSHAAQCCSCLCRCCCCCR